MTTHSLITEFGLITHLITDGYDIGNEYWITLLLKDMEKTSVSTCLIDYTCIEPGLADRVLYDELIERLET